MSITSSHDFKEGDFYRCRYTDEYAKTIFDPRYCFEGLVGVKIKNGQVTLYDTFWGIHEIRQNSKCFSPADVGEKIELMFLANINNLEKGYKEDAAYYDEDDLVQLHEQHACSQSCIEHYRRKGAERNGEVLTHSINCRLQQIQDRIYSLKQDEGRLTAYLKQVERKDYDNIWI
jgi:hypothetical protein